MRRHVQEMPRLGYQRAQGVTVAQRLLGVRRHLHQVDIHVQEPGMLPCPRQRGKGIVQNGNGFERICTCRGLAARQVPKLPGGPVHDGLGDHGADIEVVCKLRVNPAHRVGKCVIPRAEVLDIGRLGIARGQRPDKCALDRCQLVQHSPCRMERGVRQLDALWLLLLLEGFPRLVVVRPDAIGDAPMRHGTCGIGIQSPPKTVNRRFVVVTIGPCQTAVEPELCVFRIGGNRSRIGPKIIVFHGVTPQNQYPDSLHFLRRYR